MTTSATFNNMRVFAAEQFKESVSETTANSVLYLTYGKVDAWPDEANPDAANTAVVTTYSVWANMIGGKRLFGSDVAHVTARFDWASGETYVAYDHRNPDLLDGNTPFYVMNSSYSVYKCVANNYSNPSTVEPTSVNPNFISSTSDGYSWKYMYTLSDVEILRYLTDEYMPVKTLMADDGSLQWQVQENAEDGGISSILVTANGTGYLTSSNTTITISGDGSGATATATIDTLSNTISSIRMTDTGSGYTWADVSIGSTEGGSDAQAVAIMSPPGGHGSNPLYELGGRNIILNPKLKYDESGVLPTSNDFRQVAIITDPRLAIGGSISQLIAFLQAMSVTCEGTGDYTDDETVYQGASEEAAVFKGRVVSWDSSTRSIRIGLLSP